MQWNPLLRDWLCFSCACGMVLDARPNERHNCNGEFAFAVSDPAPQAALSSQRITIEEEYWRHHGLEPKP